MASHLSHRICRTWFRRTFSENLLKVPLILCDGKTTFESICAESGIDRLFSVFVVFSCSPTATRVLYRRTRDNEMREPGMYFPAATNAEQCLAECETRGSTLCAGFNMVRKYI